MTKAITDPFWKRIDRLNALKTMIRTITKITKEYQTKDYFRANLEEDAAEFMCFLLNHHPWEAFMSILSIK